MGMSSAVRFAAWIPAIRAAASTSPLVMALLATLVVVSGSIETRHRASARPMGRLPGRDVDHAGTAQRVEIGQHAVGHEEGLESDRPWAGRSA